MGIIEIDDLVKTFNGVPAVRGVSLDVEQHEIVGLLGPSGCGKTTILRCVSGLEVPDSGRIVIDGQEVFSARVRVAPEKRGLGMVFQSYALWPHMTVSQNVRFTLDYSKTPKPEHPDREAAALDAVGMRDFGKRYPTELSGGQQQRVAVARAISGQPKVLLFDEPLSNLDARLRTKVRLELKVLLERIGATALYVTHDQTEAMALCDRIAVMSDGVIRQLDTPDNVYHRPIDTFVASFVGDANLLPFRRSSDDGVLYLGSGPAPLGFEQPPAELDEGFLAVHPERFEFVTGQADRPQWRGTVTTHEFLGAASEYLVTLDEAGLSVRVDSRLPTIKVGESVRVAHGPGSPIWLPLEDRPTSTDDSEYGRASISTQEASA